MTTFSKTQDTVFCQKLMPEESKDIIRTNTASILDRAHVPTHKNITASERKAIKDLKSDKTRNESR